MPSFTMSVTCCTDDATLSIGIWTASLILSRSIVKMPSTSFAMPFSESKTILERFLDMTYRMRTAAMMVWMPPLTRPEALYMPMTELVMSMRYLTIFVSHSLAIILRLAVILSNEPPVASNRADTALSSSIWLCSCLSWIAPSSPDFAFTASRSVSMSFRVLMYWRPASSPGPPKMSASAVPTAAEDSGSSESLADTSCMTSKVVFAPLCRSFCTCSESMPIPLSASDVAVVISRIRRFASFMASTPLSEYIPCFVASVAMATNSSADIPASLK